MGIFLLNSVKVTTIATIGQVLSCAMAAFAFARLRDEHPRVFCDPPVGLD